jgi:hypothetical protein
MWIPKEDAELQNAIHAYIAEHDLFLDESAEYIPIIDGVRVYVDGCVVLQVGLPPVSNYRIRETEHTDKYMRQTREPAFEQTTRALRHVAV